MARRDFTPLRLIVFQHEWSTHGTCYSTLNTSCLPPNSPPGAEAVAFFQRVVALFQKLPTYDWLASQGITPSSTETYTLSQLTDALKVASGVCHKLSSSTIRLIKLIRSLRRSLGALSQQSTRSVGTSTSRAHSSMVNLFR